MIFPVMTSGFILPLVIISLLTNSCLTSPFINDPIQKDFNRPEQKFDTIFGAIQKEATMQQSKIRMF